jgi:hypothetical protein
MADGGFGLRGGDRVDLPEVGIGHDFGGRGEMAEMACCWRAKS